ncbi:MAG: four helix bundle protein [Candidatus Gastranaerophilaceae bacterium]
MHHKDLEAWKESINFVTKIYLITNKFPKYEMFSLTNQIRRCVISIPSNIAEGCARYSARETSRFLDIALGSIAELETQLIISKNLGYLDNLDVLLNELGKISALTSGLKKYLDKKT